MGNNDIFHQDFQLKPWWWEAYEPQALDLTDVPPTADVAIVGAGYAGISAALELAKNNINAVVFDAEQPGFGGSTRSGGMISGGRNVGKRYTRTTAAEAARIQLLRRDAADGFELIERLIEEEKIDCGWHKTGSFTGAWCRKHLDAMADKVAQMNEISPGEAYLVQPEQQREHIGSDYYRGGMVVERGAHLHPALYFKGLLDACERRNVTICAKAGVTKITQVGAAWRIETSRGATEVKDVMIATNGYTGDITPDLKRRVVPVGSYMIATEELPEDLARSISPKNRSLSDSRRVLTYYRMSPDGKRLLFGGRAKFGQTEPLETAPILYGFMTDRFPQLKGSRITHAWTGNVAFTMDEVPHMGTLDGLHYALGCNGSGVAMMTYLGTQTARKIAGVTNQPSAFDGPDFPTHPLYHGNPWFVPIVGRYFRTRDWIDRHFN
ncbi:MAG: FAD-binding oxidoreductase [Rhodospirillales bacterium]|nr:FAD-binding oxidoreductase [Rhodospirillales bacterium]